MLDRVLKRIDEDLEASLERLFTLLRIESISTDPAYAASVRTAAEWLASELSGLGFTASLRATPGHPIVVAHARGNAAGPTVASTSAVPAETNHRIHSDPQEQARQMILGRAASAIAIPERSAASRQW